MAFYNRFVITLSDEEIKIDLITNNNVHSSLKGDLNNRKEVDNFFSQSKNGRIIILIKNSKREEISKNYPNLSAKEAHNQAKEFLKSQYNDDRFSALANIENNNYTYINIEITPFIRSWLDYIMALNNRVHSIYTLFDQNKIIDIIHISTKNKNLLKLYNPSISPIIFTELLNFYIGSILKIEIIFMAIIFFTLWRYI